MLIVVVALLAGLAVVPVVRMRAGVARGWPVVFGALAAGVVAAATAWSPAPSAFATASRPLEQHVDGYVGSASCRSCHPSEHGSWHASFHRTMTQLATRDALQASFERVELDWFGAPVALEWRGDRLWTTFERRGARPAAVDRPVEQLTGSHHLQVLWYSTGEGRELAPVPMCFQIAEAKWIPLTSVFVLPPEFRDPPEPGAWNRSCTMCHTTDARPRVGDGAPDTHVGELGVACESCHGPGERHVAANKDPLRRFRLRGVGDDTIENPATMPPARSAEACGQCHSVSILRRQHFDSWRSDGSPFEPGDDLQRSHLVIDLGDRDAPELREELRRNPNFFRSNFWSDGEVRLSGREFSGLRRSPCYQHGDAARQIDCTSCHALHEERRGPDQPGDWRDDQLADGMRGNAACTQCHEAFADDDALARHTRHAPTSSGSSCMNCHMPRTSIGLMKASRSHAITSPDVGVELRTGRPNACNLCHLDRTLQWTGEQLMAGWQKVAPPLSDEERDVAAGVRWILTGDAGQRMLAAYAFGQPDAQRASGDDWLPPFLGRLLDDPYYVVRFNAARSLRSIGYGNLVARYDFLAADERAKVYVDNVTGLWQSRRSRGAARPELLLDERGLVRAAFDRLYARRDDRPVYLAE